MQALAKNFGVHAAIINDLKLAPATVETEDLAVGSGGLTSGRDRDVAETSIPRDSAHWISVTMRRNSTAGLYTGRVLTTNSVEVWLPKDRAMVQRIVGIYFTRLNYHRPIFAQKVFTKTCMKATPFSTILDMCAACTLFWLWGPLASSISVPPRAQSELISTRP